MSKINSNIHDNFEGICLASDSFAINIHSLLCAAQVLQMSKNNNAKLLGNEILSFACEYAKTAAEKELAQ
ncbi:hypothetical protein [Escherichia coli]|uniref:hypothetical protein n=1 Tax=Escherichia coli TaxID=562 RepID=UPI001FCEEB18|nr:hypothetical protein [Escherichia coli]